MDFSCLVDFVDNLLTSDPVKVATRQMAPTAAGPALAAPKAQTAIAAPAVDDAYEEEAAAAPAPVVAATPKAKPSVAPVKASDELAAKLDSLFDE